MLKVMTIVGTRPEIIKLSEVIKELDKFTKHTLVHTGQNYDYELNQIFFKDLSLNEPNYYLDASKKSLASTISDIILKTDKLIEKIKPDAFLVYGDTNSCLSVISAKKRKIPIFHMEAGNRCFDQRVPEEVNRKIVDHLSDINLPLSTEAKAYLIQEGIKAETIIKIGSPMQEVILKNFEKISKSKILKKEKLKSNKYFLVSIHREENVDSKINFSKLLKTINEIETTYKIPIIISTHPRTKKKLEEISFKKKSKLIRFMKPFSFTDYNHLQMQAFCVISDSGTITEEASILNLPAITIRETHERPEGMEETSIVMSGLEKNNIMNCIRLVVKQHSKKRNFKLIKDYDVDNVSKKIVRIIYSYTDYVNRTIWKK